MELLGQPEAELASDRRKAVEANDRSFNAKQLFNRNCVEVTGQFLYLC